MDGWAWPRRQLLVGAGGARRGEARARWCSAPCSCSAGRLGSSVSTKQTCTSTLYTGHEGSTRSVPGTAESEPWTREGQGSTGLATRAGVMTQHNFRRIGQARRKVSSNAETCADATRTSHKSTGPGGPSQVRGVISPALCALRFVWAKGAGSLTSRGSEWGFFVRPTGQSH